MIKSVFGRLVSIWFALFLISGCLLLMPFFWILIGIGSKKTLNAAHFLNRAWAFFITIPSFIFINKKLLFKLRKNKKYIFVGNHQSYLDIPVCLIALPVSFRFIGKAELGKIPFFGWMYNRLYITVDRSSRIDAFRSTQKAADELKKGNSLVIFAEGGIPKNHVTLGPFKRGAFKLAFDQQVDIVPFVIKDIKKVLNSDGKWLLFPGLITFKILEPISISDYKEENLPELIEQTRERILNELK